MEKTIDEQFEEDLNTYKEECVALHDKYIKDVN